MNDTNDELQRRTFLKKSAVGSLGLGGLTAGGGKLTAQDEGEGGQGEGADRPLYQRRFVFPYPERLGDQQEPQERLDPEGDLLQKILIVTDRMDTRPDELAKVQEENVNECEFGGDWPPEDLAVWEAIIVDWKNTLQIFGSFEASPTVQATQLVERNTVFADPNPDPVPLGMTFIVNSVVTCPGDLVGVTAQKIPGVHIATGEGESTGEATEN